MTLDMGYEKKKAQAKKKLTERQRKRQLERQRLEAKGYVFDDEKNYVTTPRGNKFPIGAEPEKKKKVGSFYVSSGPTRMETAMNEFPLVDICLRTRYTSTGTWAHYIYSLIGFCIAKDITPKEFAELRHNDKEQDEAIELASDYIQDIIFPYTKKYKNQEKKGEKNG